MCNLIDKDTLVAEIKKLKEEIVIGINSYEMGEENGKAEMCDMFLSFIDTLEVKEVDLEKFTEKINTFQARYKHPEITSIKGAMAFMARMFYQYPSVAREWYESLPKTTMD